MSKQYFRQIYFYEFKPACSTEPTARNINDVWAEGSINVSTVQRWFIKCHPTDFDLQNRGGRGHPSFVHDDKLKAIVEVDSTEKTRVIANELKDDHTSIVRPLEQIGKVGEIDKWVLYELKENITSHNWPSKSYTREPTKHYLTHCTSPETGHLSIRLPLL